MTPREHFLASIHPLGYNDIISYVQTLASAFGVEESLARSCFVSIGMWEATHEEFVAELQKCVDRKELKE